MNITTLTRPLVRHEAYEGVLRLTLDDPGRRNALSRALMSELHAAILAAGRDPAVRVIVLAAEGRAFSAGHDLKELTAHRADPDGGRDFFTETFAACADLMTAIVRAPKPIIAEVAGVATAAGCQLVASCDLAVAAEGASFATPGVLIGLFCSTPMVALTRSIARKHAMELLLTGEPISAAEAHRMGLVNRVVAEDLLTEETMLLAETIASRSPLTLRYGKETAAAQSCLDLEAAYALAAAAMTENLLAYDAEEGIAAFLGKRAPVWQDR